MKIKEKTYKDLVRVFAKIVIEDSFELESSTEEERTIFSQIVRTIGEKVLGRELEEDVCGAIIFEFLLTPSPKRDENGESIEDILLER